ncbi:MAG: NAD(P)H-dependent oxidoreductase subunit E [Pseudomonadota bacterium]
MNKHSPGSEFTPIRPGRGDGGKRKPRKFPKGRQVQPVAHEEVSGLLGDRTVQRDHLIEYLHLIQDKHGHISAANLAALADIMRIPMAEAYEVATFYDHFDVVKEGEEAPAELTIRVCDSLSCALAGADQLIEELQGKAGPSIRVLHAPCMGRCQSAPAASVGKNYMDNVTAEGLLTAAYAGEVKPVVPDYQGIEAYKAEGGYQMVEKCRSGGKTPDDVIEELLEAGLRGLGGAGFPSGQKWKFVRMEKGPRYMCINGDEGEPGTFKDRHYLERRPHQFLEGMLIGAWAVEAKRVYIYMRDEYPTVLKILADEIKAIEEAGIVEPGYVELRRGAGAYICGEESAMIESVEGKRGMPRHRPPFVAQVGVFNRPTLVHNVETVYWMPQILEKGAEWFASQGKEGHKGARSYSVSGRVKNPGVVLAPAGVTVNELINDYCGGMLDGHTFKGYLPGGASGGILPAAHGDVPLDFGGPLAELGCFVGSHAVVVMSDKDDMREAALNLLHFFEDESCGQCTPCRVGCEKAAKLMKGGDWNHELLTELAGAMMDASICGLGQAAPNPILTVMKYFPEEFR